MIETETDLTEQERDALQELSQQTGKPEQELIHEVVYKLINSVASYEVAIINELAKIAANRDKEALKRSFELPFFRSRLKKICQFIAERNRGLNPDDLEQEAYKRIFEKIDQFESKSAFLNWVSPIIGNVYADLVRKNERLSFMQKAKGIWKDRQDLPSPEDLRREWNRY